MSREPLMMLAVDQRPWLTKALYDHTDTASPDERAAIARGKHMVLDGLLAAADDGAGRAQHGTSILVDENLGPGVAERARAHGVVVSMPLERGGRAEYEDEPADVGAFLTHHRPDLAKVLVRYNIEGDAELNRRQLARLTATADAAHRAGCRFLFELLVPATDEQLASVGGSEDRFAEELRPSLTHAAMSEIAAQVDVDVWKLEHLGTTDGYVTAAELARDVDSTCILLGAGAPVDVVRERLDTAVKAGFAGFAIGRSIWWEPMRLLLSGATTYNIAVDTVASRYASFVDTYRAATAATTV